MKIKFQNDAHLKKRSYFWSTFHIFLVTRETTQKFLKHISHLHSYTHFAHPIDFFCLTNFNNYELIMYGFSLVLFLVLILFRAILGQSINNKLKFRLECLLLVFIYTSARFMVICKPRTLNDGRWRLSSVQKTQKALLLQGHFVFENYYNLMASLSCLEALLLDVTSYTLNNCSF